MLECTRGKACAKQPPLPASTRTCSSSAGLMQGSSRNTWLAAVKLMPTLPARMLSRNTVVGGSF